MSANDGANHPPQPGLDARLRLAPLRLVAATVAALNLGYFGVEFAVASAIGSVALFADSVDFLEDAAVNLLIVMALGWPARPRAAVGAGLGLVLLAPGLATLWTAWGKLGHPVPPAPLALSLTGLGAFAVNFGCALMLARAGPAAACRAPPFCRRATMSSPMSRSSPPEG